MSSMVSCAYAGDVNDVSWGALALALTALGGIYTWWALRHRGFAAAVRAAGVTLLPMAAWMTGLLQVFGTVTNAFAHFFARLVFSPVVWLGVVVFVVAFVLIGASNVLTRRETSAPKRETRRADRPKAVGPTTPHDPLIDDEMAEIQAILKKRGIS
jgi:heme exporter protein D